VYIVTVFYSDLWYLF